MARPPKCPMCAMTIPLRYVTASKPFVCPSCHELIRVTRSSQRIGVIVSLGVTLLIAILAGARDLALVAVTLMLFVPVTFIVGFMVHTVFGFPLEAVPTGANARLGDYDNDG